MATMTEIQSLEEINYKSKIKIYLMPLIVSFLFMMAFLNFFPVGAQLKTFLKKNLKGSACNPDYDQINIEWLMPKLVVSDLVLPASCLGQEGAPLEFRFININFQFINFSPFGIPFKIDTEMNGQPLTIYYVQGFGERMVRIKDQTIVLSRLEPLMSKFKLGGSMTVDLNALMTNQNAIKSLSFKAESKDLQIPTQDLQGFKIQNQKINTLYLEAESATPPRIEVSKMIVGDEKSPIRANFRGTIDLQNGAAAFSPMNLLGEVAFSETFRQELPLIDMMFQSFTQKDGFYQIRLGGTLGAPKPSAP